jgi:hypothetical protein
MVREKRSKVRFVDEIRTKLYREWVVPTLETLRVDSLRILRRLQRPTGIDHSLLQRLKVILSVLASGRNIDADKFDKFAEGTSKLYVTTLFLR